MAVAMVIMESPAIIMAVLLANSIRHKTALEGSSGLATQSVPLGKILHESFADGAHLLLLGAMAVGMISGESGKAMMQPFSGDLFKGMLAFFLLDMGMMVARNFNQAKSASYIVVPAVLRYAIPEANPSIYFGLSLGVTFPINILAGISIYTWAAVKFLS